MVILVSAVQLASTEPAIFVTLGKSKVTSDEQPSNALSPTSVTSSGMVMAVSLLDCLNDSLLMARSDLGSLISFSVVISKQWLCTVFSAAAALFHMSFS